MYKEFERLTPADKELLMKAPALISILIAGADDDINREEIATAGRMVRYRRISGDIRLFSYYDNVHMHFQDDLARLEQDYPKNAYDRYIAIATELSRLNNIFPKLNKDFAVAIYQSLRKFAEKVAGASGGFLGYGSYTAKERAWMELPMIEDPGVYLQEEAAEAGLHIDPQYLDSSPPEVHP